MSNKTYTIKVYDKLGTTFKGVLAQLSSYSYGEAINAGGGEMTIKLSNEIVSNVGLAFLDMIKIYVQDKDTTSLLLYSGYYYKSQKKESGSDTSTVISIIGYVSLLGFTPDMGSTTGIQVVRNSMTITNAIKDVIDKFKTTQGISIVDYSATSIETSATTVSYTSQTKSCLDTIERLREMVGSTWFWRLGADNILYFRQYATTPVHTLVMGKDIAEITTTESVDDIKNFYILWNGLQVDDEHYLSKVYYSGASVTSYWKRFEQATDGRLKDETYMDQLGEAFVTANKDVNKAITLVVKDNNYGEGYDIESIHAGDTIRILNTDDSDLYSGNLVVTSLTYTPEYVTLQIADSRTITSRKLNDIRKRMDTTVYSDGVETATLIDID